MKTTVTEVDAKFKPINVEIFIESKNELHKTINAIKHDSQLTPLSKYLTNIIKKYSNDEYMDCVVDDLDKSSKYNTSNEDYPVCSTGNEAELTTEPIIGTLSPEYMTMVKSRDSSASIAPDVLEIEANDSIESAVLEIEARDAKLKAMEEWVDELDKKQPEISVETLDDEISEENKVVVQPNPQLIDDVMQSLEGYSHLPTSDKLSTLIEGSLNKVKHNMITPEKLSEPAGLTPPDIGQMGQMNHKDWNI